MLYYTILYNTVLHYTIHSAPNRTTESTVDHKSGSCRPNGAIGGRRLAVVHSQAHTDRATAQTVDESAWVGPLCRVRECLGVAGSYLEFEPLHRPLQQVPESTPKAAECIINVTQRGKSPKRTYARSLTHATGVPTHPTLPLTTLSSFIAVGFGGRKAKLDTKEWFSGKREVCNGSSMAKLVQNRRGAEAYRFVWRKHDRSGPTECNLRLKGSYRFCTAPK